MKIKFHSNNDLPLYKTIGTPSISIVIRAVSDKNKFKPQAFLD